MSEIGDYALRFALVIAALGLGAGVYAGFRRSDEWTRLAERSVVIVFGFVTLAIGLLFVAFANFEFQLTYVAGHSARSMALPYRRAALCRRRPVRWDRCCRSRRR